VKKRALVFLTSVLKWLAESNLMAWSFASCWASIPLIFRMAFILVFFFDFFGFFLDDEISFDLLVFALTLQRKVWNLVG